MLGCNVYSDGSAAAIDTWNPSSTKTNVLDQDQVNKTQCHVILSNMYDYCNYTLCKYIYSACRKTYVSIVHRLRMGLCVARE